MPKTWEVGDAGVVILPPGLGVTLGQCQTWDECGIMSLRNEWFHKSVCTCVVRGAISAYSSFIVGYPSPVQHLRRGLILLCFRNRSSATSVLPCLGFIGPSMVLWRTSDVPEHLSASGKFDRRVHKSWIGCSGPATAYFLPGLGVSLFPWREVVRHGLFLFPVFADLSDIPASSCSAIPSRCWRKVMIPLTGSCNCVKPTCSVQKSWIGCSGPATASVSLMHSPMPPLPIEVSFSGFAILPVLYGLREAPLSCRICDCHFFDFRFFLGFCRGFACRVHKSWIGCSGPATTSDPFCALPSQVYSHKPWTFELLFLTARGCHPSPDGLTSRPLKLCIPQRSDVPKTRIGGSGAGTPSSGIADFAHTLPIEVIDTALVCLPLLKVVDRPLHAIIKNESMEDGASRDLPPAFLWVGHIAQAFFLHLMLIALLVLVRSLLVQCRFKRHTAGRVCLAMLQGPTSRVIIAWGDIASAQRASSGPAQSHKGRQGHNDCLRTRLRLSLSNRIALGILALMPCPRQVWAAPKPWGEAVNIVLETVRLLPEPLPVSQSNLPSQVPFWARPGFVPESLSHLVIEQGAAPMPPLLEHPGIPVPPHAAELPAESDRTFVQAYSYVMAPHYQAEILPLPVGIPTDLGAFCTTVRRALSNLRLRFMSDLVPTVPQVSPEFASLIVAPRWPNAAGKQIVVFDMRACGGPIYSDFVWDRVSYGECKAVARRHGIDQCSIYAQGHTQPLTDGSSFLAVTGGVIQYQPRNTAAVWCGPLHARFDRPNAWSGDPDLPPEEAEWPLFVSHHDQFSLYSADRFPGETAARAIADLVDRRPEAVLFVTSPGRRLEDVNVRGTFCRDVMAVFPLTPSPDRQGVIVFVDLRQVGQLVSHMFLEQPWVAPSEIIRHFHLRAPIGFKVTCWPRPDHTGRIPCVEGDIIVFGFVPDDWDEEDECDSSDSDSSSPEGTQLTPDDAPGDDDNGTTGQSRRSPHHEPSGTSGPRLRSSRSRSPRAHSGSRSIAETCSTDKSLLAIPAIKVGLRTPGSWSLRVEDMWVPKLFQQAIAHGTCVLTSVDEALLDETLQTCSPLLSPAEGAELDQCYSHQTNVVQDFVRYSSGGRSGPQEHKWSTEPQSNDGPRQSLLDDLRSITLELGGHWPYTQEGHAHVPGMLRDFEEEDGSFPTERCWVRVIVLKWLFTSERLSVAMDLPATPAEAIEAIQGARARLYAQDFPHLLAAAPQPLLEACVFLANPSWYGFDLIACADLSRIDGRIFALRVPEYADRQVVLTYADLSPRSNIEVLAGFLDAPLIDGVPLHLFPGVTLRFFRREEPPGQAPSIAEILESTSIRETEDLTDVPTPEGYYCLVLRNSFRLFRAENMLPMNHRACLASAIGCLASEVGIYPASPRLADIAIEGHHCRTALVVVPDEFVATTGDTFCFIVDSRVILQGFMCFKADVSPISASRVLRELNAEAPLGLRVAIDDVTDDDALLDVQPGQVLTARYILADDEPGNETSEHAGWPDQVSDDSSVEPRISEERQLHAGDEQHEGFQVLIPCFLFTQDYSPELYEIPLSLPTTAADLVEMLLLCRATSRQEIAPMPCAVRPQPDTAYASFLMLPAWPLEDCIILVDGRSVDARIFALRVPTLMDKRSLIIAAAYDPGLSLLVFVRDSPWPLREDAVSPLYTGDLVIICHADHPTATTGYLSDMLQASDLWDSAGVPQEPVHGFTLVLDHGEPLLIQYRDNGESSGSSTDSVDSTDQRIALCLGLDESEFTIHSPSPPIEDHWERGRPVRQVYVVTRLRGDSTPERCLTTCVIDARPALLGILTMTCTGRSIDLGAYVHSLSRVCPAGFVVTVRGGDFGVALPSGFREISIGSVFTVYFSEPAAALGGTDPGPSDASSAQTDLAHDCPETPVATSSQFPVVLFRRSPELDGFPSGVQLLSRSGNRHKALRGREPLYTCLIIACVLSPVEATLLSSQCYIPTLGDMWRSGFAQEAHCFGPLILTPVRGILVDGTALLIWLTVILCGVVGSLLQIYTAILGMSGPKCKAPGYKCCTRPCVTPVGDHSVENDLTNPPTGFSGDAPASDPGLRNSEGSASTPFSRGHPILDPPPERPTPFQETDPGFGTRVPFVIFPPEYWPEFVAAHLALPVRVREALASLEQQRTGPAHRRGPRLVPVFPQPQTTVASVLALPNWEFEGVPVLVDYRIGPARSFCIILPYWISRELFLHSIGAPEESQCRVFLRDVPWALQQGANLFPQTGDLVTICDLRSEPGPRLELHHMLEPGHDWDLSFELPGDAGDINWVLSDGIHTALPIVGDSFALSSAHTAAALGLEAGQFQLVPAVPAVSDHAHLGTRSQRVLSACPIEDPWSEGGGQRVPYILDQRPVLLPMLLAFAPEGILDVAGLCRRVAWRCPQRHHVRLFGGQNIAGSGNHYRQVRPGEVITIEFHPDRIRDIFSEYNSDTYTPDSEQLDGAAGAHGTRMGAGPFHGDTGSTSQPPAPSSSSTSSREQTRRLHSAPALWQQAFLALLLSLPCRLLLLLAVVSVEVGGMPLPPTQHYPDPPSGELELTALQALDHGHARKTASKHVRIDSERLISTRPLPTPCRNIRACAGEGLDPLNCATVDVGSCRTLLEESAAAPDCKAFWLAATLLDVVFEHFLEQAGGSPSFIEGPVTRSPPSATIRLAEHLPPIVSVDLSHVSMPLCQSIDQVLQWTTPGLWVLEKGLPAGLCLHPTARTLLEQCSPGDPPAFHSTFIYTDGSYHQGISSWAFVVFGYQDARMHFLGWAAGKVPRDSEDPLFLCPCDSHALSGEQTALLWSAVWALQGPQSGHISVYSDCLVALNQAQGSFGWSAFDKLAPLCRATFQALAVARPAWDSAIHHVRSHQGCPANELADALAKHACGAPHTCFGAHQIWAAEWIRAGTLPWLWAQLETVRAPECWPQQVGSTFVDKHRHTASCPLQPYECYRVLGLQEHESEDHFQPIQISLRILSVNAQSLTDPDQAKADPALAEGFTGRARYLREQFTQLQVHVSALQEARTRTDATYVSDTHIRYCTACDSGGNFGCELWFSRLLPFVWRQHNFGHFHPNDFFAISSSPRDLIVRFSRSGVHILFACIHAPVAGHKDRDPWWQYLRGKLSKLRKEAELVLVGDFNAGFSASVSHRIGDLVWQVQHPPPVGLSQVLAEHDLWLPSTFSTCHVGPHDTWLSPTGATGSRLDYIAVPSGWCVPPAGSWIDFSLDWGQSRVDHYGVCLDTSFLARAKRQQRQKTANIDREAMSTPEGQQTLRHICHSIPLLPWTCDVHRHYLAIEEHLSRALAISFPSRRGVCRSSHFSSSTWDLRQKRVWFRKQVAWERTRTCLAEALAALRSWKAGSSLIVGRVIALFPRILAARRLQGLVADLQATKRSLRLSIRSDISLRIQETAAKAASLPSADVVSRLRPLLGPPKRRIKQRRALHSVCHPDGRPAQNATEIEDIWIEHFGNIEDGTRVDPVSFVHGVQETQRIRDLESYSLGVTDVPSRLELEQAFRQTQTGRAEGLDGVPGELLHFAAASASRSLFQLFLKTTLRAAEPIQFKGGALHAVWKGKSNPSFCSAHRGILVSSNIGKAFHRIARARAVPALRNVTTDMQIGGLPSFPVVLASHFVRLFQSGSRQRLTSHGLLFLDLREAFYRVVRPLLVGAACHDGQVAAAVKAVQLPPGVMHELHEHIQKISAAKEAGASDWADVAITEALNGTWFRFQSGRQVVQTAVGSRPGDNLADICFSFIFAKVLHSVQQDLQEKGLVPEIPWSPEMLNQVGRVETAATDTDATWMDDATFLVSSPSAAQLPQSLVSTGSSVLDACVSRALLPNLDKGKTEFLACPIGSGSRQVRKQLFIEHEPCVHMDCRLWPGASVRVRPSYQHLGGIIHHDTSLIRELKRRAALAWKAFNARKRLVFGSPGVSRKDKIVLFESLILSILLYGAGTWDHLSPKEEAVLANAYHGMCFHMLRPAFSHEEALHLGGTRVLAILELPTLSTLLHVARLRHLLSCIRTAVPVMWAMLHWQGTWLTSARLSIQWLWALVDGGTQHSDWTSAWQVWRDLCVSHPQKWKGLVRKAQTQATLKEQWESAETHHLGLLLRQLRLKGASTPERPRLSGPTRHCCAPCHRTFASYQAWSVHAFKCHGLVGEYRCVLPGLQCQACLRHFTTNVKLCRHLQHFPACRHFLQAKGFHCTPEPGIGNRKAVDPGNFQAPSLQAEGPPLAPEAGHWDGYLDRPSIEVLECLTHIPHGLCLEAISSDVVWQRAHVAFSSVCLPNRKIAATAKAWEESLLLTADGGKENLQPLLDVARWLTLEDPVDWLVSEPACPQVQICTFRDARQVLPILDVSGISTDTTTHVSTNVPVYIRVGPGAWLKRHSKDLDATVDFSHQECLDTFAAGRTPSFFEDLSDGVVFVLSVVGLQHWADPPSPPVRRKPFLSQLARATLASDLLRFALRLWLRRIPAVFLCPAGLDFVPEPLSALPGLISSRLGEVVVWRPSSFDWEPLSFTFLN